MSKPLRVVLTALKWLGGVLFFLVALFFFVNAFDEDLKPEAIALATAPANPYPPAKNLYIALLGFPAADGETAEAMAERRIRANRELARMIQEDPKRALSLIEQYEKPAGLRFDGKFDFCALLSGSCWSEAGSHSAEITALRNSNRTLYERYLGLHALPVYFETEPPHVLMLSAYPPSDIRRLFIASTVIDLKETPQPLAKRRVALQGLRDDVATWRRMLVGEGALTSKMLAIVSLHSDYVLLGDMIAAPGFDLAPLSDQIEDTLTLVGPDDWKLRGLFAFEYRVATNMMEETRRREPALLSSLTADEEGSTLWQRLWARLQWYFFKFNATENSSAQVMNLLQDLASGNPRDFEASRQKFERWVAGHLGLGPGLFYNPVGKLTVGISAPAYTDYPLRVYDVAAYARAVRLAYEIRRQDVTTADVPEFSRRHPEWSTHPVSGEAFTWDPAARRLTVPTMGPYSTSVNHDRRFDVPVLARQ
jgi:hypothetical protein